MSSLVSVVIPTYNRAALLREAAQSVLAQDYPDLEIIVVDDGSTDDTAAVAKSLGPKVNYTCIERSNGGPAAARNRGIELAQGQFIAFLDSDDMWKPEKLSRQMPLFTQPDIGLVYCGVEFFLNDVGRITSVYRVPEETTFHQALGHQIVALQGSVVRREVFARVGNFDTELKGTDDWDFSVRVALHYRMIATSEPLLRIRLHEGHLSKNFQMMHRNCLKVLEKNSHHHANCQACRDAIRQSRRIMYEDHYVKLVTAARQSWRQGSRFTAVGQAAKALWTFPPAVPRIARKLLRKLKAGT